LATAETLWPGEISRRILALYNSAAYILFEPTGGVVRATTNANDFQEWLSTMGTPAETIQMAPKPNQPNVSVEWEPLTDTGDWTDYANDFGNILVPKLPRRSVQSLLNEAVKHMFFDGIVIIVNQNNGYVEFRRYADAAAVSTALNAIDPVDLNADHIALQIVRPVENTATTPFER
jgi:hypothetical protein